MEWKMAVFKHPNRQSLKSELEACIILGKLKGQQINEAESFLQSIKEEGFFSKEDLVAGYILLRKHNENKLNKKLNKYISIWPFAGYGRSNDRSPSQDWWTNVVKSLVDQKINIIHCGYINEPDLSNNTKYYKKITNMDFFEQIKISLGTTFGSGTLLNGLCLINGNKFELSIFSRISTFLKDAISEGLYSLFINASLPSNFISIF